MCAEPLHTPASSRCRECPTRTVCLAAQVDDAQLDELPELFRCDEPLASGAHLYHADDPAVAQYHVRSGMFKTYVINAEGDEYVTGFYLPGDILGHVHKQGCHAESAVALDTASVCALDEAGMQGCADMGLITPLFNQLAANAGIEARQQINLKQTTAQSRFAGFCLMLGERLERLGRSAALLPTPMSRTDLASYLGMTLESLSRVISRLHAARVINARRDCIEILQPDTLKTLGLHVDQ